MRCQDSIYNIQLFCTFKTSFHHILTMSSPTPEHQLSSDSGDVLPGLSAEQLNLLSSIRVARVTIDSLTVPACTTPRKASSKGKPPRPLTSIKWLAKHIILFSLINTVMSNN